MLIAERHHFLACLYAYFLLSTIQIMSINGVPTNEASLQECITLVSSAPMNLVLELQQNPPGYALVDRVK